ncbi:hypothetical protein JOD43_001071 [Pullulanibacillus pueri]|uniref:Uncharacterized protein n=1 Tax=Pullulanibacillus pueri TaxID=1437324 RepID=A0A8J3ELJ3_9BACL|nr:hypothetical protein [Pullulanibacillus pueri]MBM7680905.1 hypothetical protein [Pullulanibacillus pueri]GGH81278.1 hypothetical protein GCM10007096_18940 [Pullulanibacillus pueri]
MEDKTKYIFADLQEDDISKIQALEDRLGVTLIAYEDPEEAMKKGEDFS